jgi:diacylglycerol kinase (ATP)
LSVDSWTIIVNPTAGRGRAEGSAQVLVRALENSGAAVSVSTTAARGDAERLAAEAVKAGATRVVACGGDGTVHEVVNGLMSARDESSDTALGILSCGRCNDLVYALGLPKDPVAGAEALVHSTVRRIDLGRIGDRYYTTVATLGFDSEVSQYVNEGSAPSFLSGTAAYLYGAIVKLIQYRSPSVRIKGDFGEYEGAIFLAATGNTSRYGGRMEVTPSAIVDDGKLDLCLIRPIPRRVVLQMLPKTFKGNHVGHPAVSVQQTRRLEIESEAPLWLWADGEQITQTPATIEVVPLALPVLVPQEANGGRTPQD